MDQELKNICKEFEQLRGYLQETTAKKDQKLDELFYKFIDSFHKLKEEKLDYPKEFQNDVRLYKEEFKPIIKKFEDKQIRYLMLSDFYDYVRLTKRYTK